MKRFLILATTAHFVTSAAMAQEHQTIACRFVTECLDTDGCEDSTFQLTLSFLLKPLGPNGMISRAEKNDVNGSTTGLVATRNEVVRYTSGEFFEGTEEALTINADGDARFVVTLPEVPMIITYAGRCEAVE